MRRSPLSIPDGPAPAAWRAAVGRRRPAGTLLLLLLAASAALTGCDEPVLGVTWVRADQHVLVDGARNAGPLLVTGGDARLAPGSRTDGPVLLLGGDLTIDGLVTGDVLAVAGTLRLGPWAAVHGNVVAGRALERHPDALLLGEVSQRAGWPVWLSGVWRVLLQAVATAAAAAAWARWAPRRLDALGDVVDRHAPLAALVGSVALVVTAVAAIALAIALLRVPAGVWASAVAAAVVMGWAVLGSALARRVGRGRLRGRLRGLEGRTVWLAALGGFGVALLSGIVEWLPWVGGALALVASAVGLGAIALTGFGAQPFPRPVATRGAKRPV